MHNVSALIPVDFLKNNESSSMSQASVERKLDTFLREFREGRREGSIISTQTVESLCADDKQVWRTIRKELEDIGVTVAAFNNNKDFIINWVSNAVASGAFEEQRFDTNSIAGPREKFSVDQLTGTYNLIVSQPSSHNLDHYQQMWGEFPLKNHLSKHDKARPLSAAHNVSTSNNGLKCRWHVIKQGCSGKQLTVSFTQKCCRAEATHPASCCFDCRPVPPQEKPHQRCEGRQSSECFKNTQ
jgi:hypothetical protein